MDTKQVESLPSWAGAWARTPIWDEEFAKRWAELKDEQPPAEAEPDAGKPRQKPATKR